MVIMHNSAKEIWDKLLSIYEQKSGQRLHFLICRLFSYCKDCADSIAQHVAELKALWTELCQERAVATVFFIKSNSVHTSK